MMSATVCRHSSLRSHGIISSELKRRFSQHGRHPVYLILAASCIIVLVQGSKKLNLVPRACDPREGTWGSGIIRCRKPGILLRPNCAFHINGQSDSSLKRIIPEPHVPSRGSQARGTRLAKNSVFNPVPSRKICRPFRPCWQKRLKVTNSCSKWARFRRAHRTLHLHDLHIQPGLVWTSSWHFSTAWSFRNLLLTWNNVVNLLPRVLSLFFTYGKYRGGSATASTGFPW
jgi:hypothetical protein